MGEDLPVPRAEFPAGTICQQRPGRARSPLRIVLIREQRQRHHEIDHHMRRELPIRPPGLLPGRHRIIDRIPGHRRRQQPPATPVRQPPEGGAAAAASLNGGLRPDLTPGELMGEATYSFVVHYSASLISAIETGTKPAKLDLVRQLDRALSAGGALIAVWPITTVGAYPSWFARIAELETQAVKIHEWELRYVPGLLQTEEYTRELMRADRPRYNLGDDDDSIEHDVEARMERQETLTSDNPPRAWFVIDESVLHRLIGSSAVMAKQLEHLETMAEMTNIIIQILPFSVKSHSGGPVLGFTADEWRAFVGGVKAARSAL
jgi:Domain of unknown function (DUF5753)/Domain of unknown function (DUF397)